MSALKKRHAKAIRLGIIQGRRDASEYETRGVQNPIHYFRFGTSNTATVPYEGKEHYVSFDLFTSGWLKSFPKAFNSRFEGMNSEEEHKERERLLWNRGIRYGTIQKRVFRDESGEEVILYEDLR